MNKKTGLLCLALALLIPLSGGFAQQPVRWETTLDNAQRLAGQSNKLVLVYFWAQWCPVCKRMEAEILDQPSVAAELSANYVLVKINADHFPTTAKQYGVTHLPTTVVITPQGQPLDSMRGRVEAAQFVGRLNLVAAAVKQRGAGVLTQIPAAKAPPMTSQPAPVQTPPAGQTPSVPPTYGQSPQQVAPAPVYGNQSPPVASPPVYGYQSPPPVVAPTNPTQPPPQVAAAAVYGNPSPPVAAPPVYANPSPPPVAALSNPTQSPAVAAPPVYANQSPPLVASAQPYGSQLPPQIAQPTTQPPPIQPTIQPTTQPTVQPSNTNGPALQGQVAPMPKGDPNFGLDGFCPVTLCEKQQWVLGDHRWGLSHRGRTYLFSGPEEMKRFNADPDRYAPVISGNDVVMAAEQGQFVRGMREHGVFFGRRVYLFSSEESLDKFAKNPKIYANQALEALRSGAFPDRQLR